METRRQDDHVLTGASMEVPVVANGAIGSRTVPALTALNLDLRDEYVADCERGLRKWNAELEKAGLEQRLALPDAGFNRGVGAFAGHFISPSGEIRTEDQWRSEADDWLPTTDDQARVAALMVPHYEPGDFAGWLAAPPTGINDLPVEYDYVRF
jgi:benzoyl-CoA 2,3-dioxygenase component B